MKYAIVEDGGKQYQSRRRWNHRCRLLRIRTGRTGRPGARSADFRRRSVNCWERPSFKGAKVQATVLAQVKGPKVIVFKYKPKKRYRVKTGHRQKYTRLQIDSIVTEIGER